MRTTIRNRRKLCRSCGGRGDTTDFGVAVDPNSPLETPTDLAHDWIISSCANEPRKWVPWRTYVERGYRAEHGQCGVVLGRSGHGFPYVMRAAGLALDGVHRERIAIGMIGNKAAYLSTQPIATVLPPKVWDAWRAAWPGCSTSIEPPKPPAPPRDRAAELTVHAVSYLRAHDGSAMPLDLCASLHCSRGLLNRVVAGNDNLVVRRVAGGRTTHRIYLAEPGFPEVPDVAPPERRSQVDRKRTPRIAPDALADFLREHGGLMKRLDASKELGVTDRSVKIAADANDDIITSKDGRFIILTLSDGSSSAQTASVT